MIKGYCDDRFLKIKSILSNQINSGYELGCSVAVEYQGKEKEFLGARSRNVVTAFKASA